MFLFYFSDKQKHLKPVFQVLIVYVNFDFVCPIAVMLKNQRSL